jgi:hypothetical protein
MPHACSIMILLEIKLAIDGNCKIFYENIYEGNEVIVLAWFLFQALAIIIVYTFQLINYLSITKLNILFRSTHICLISYHYEPSL